jgi:N-methylhydantoinase A
VCFGGSWVEDCPVFDREELRCGDHLDGPAILEQLDSTTVVPPGAAVTVDRWQNLLIDVGETA